MQMIISWLPPEIFAPAVDKYTVYIKRADILIYQQDVIATQTIVIVEDAGLVPGDVIELYITASNTAGEGPSSDIVSVTIPRATTQLPFKVLGITVEFR